MRPLTRLALSALAISSLLATACGDASVPDDEHVASSAEALTTLPSPNGKLPPPKRPPFPPQPPVDPSTDPYIADEGTPAKIWADEKIFWDRYFAGDTDASTSTAIDAELAAGSVGFWLWGARAAALVQMYDLVASVDPCSAAKYLERLRVIGEAFLRNRDDKRHAPPDAFRGTVMAAWGGPAADRDGKWNTDPVIAGLFTYAMSAFARRVADDPTRFDQSHRDTAVRFINATMETYLAFRPTMHLSDADSWAYYVLPAAYAGLSCRDDDTEHACELYKAGANHPISWNESFSMMIGLAEFALAADTPFFRGLTDQSLVNASSLYYATKEVPRLVAKNFTFFYANLTLKHWSDGAPYFEWHHQYFGAPRIQDTQHGSFELGAVAVLYDDENRLNAILTKEGRPERLVITSAGMQPFATTFLRRIWQNEPNDLWDSNTLAENVDGTGIVGHYSVHNGDCAGYVPLAQLDPWVWTRCRDTAFNDTTYEFLNVQDHAALLRYRARTPGAPVACHVPDWRARIGDVVSGSSVLTSEP